MRLTVVASRPAPHANHRQKPMENSSLDLPVDGGLVEPQRLEHEHPYAECWDAVHVVDDDETYS